MSEPRARYNAWEAGEDLDRYASELRAARGVPSPSPVVALAEEDPYADMAQEDRAALRHIQEAVTLVLCDYFPPDDIYWICEETLAQIRFMLDLDGKIHLPEIGTLQLAHDDRGRTGRLILSEKLREVRP